MTKQLYEEALSDLKTLKEVAEDNAKRAILSAVVPRIRDLIEKELLKENEEEDLDDPSQASSAPGTPDVQGDLLSDELHMSSPSEIGSESDIAISPPDEDGKVTLDVDALHAEPSQIDSTIPGEEYEINMESIDALKQVVSFDLDSKLTNLSETIEKFKEAGALVRGTSYFKQKISEMIVDVENMYEYVQESIGDSSKKSLYENKLETHFQDLNTFQEQKMSKNKKLNEEDVTLKLTGLPDDLDLDSVGVDLITGEDEEGGDDLDLDASGDEDVDGGMEGGDDLDLDVSSDEDEDDMMGMGEGQELSDDTIVEIDENMLRSEIARMKALREEDETKAQSWGHGTGPSEHDDFGGGKSEGEPTDHDVEAEFEPLGEAEECDPDEKPMSEVDDAMETEEAVKQESLSRRLGFEKRLQDRVKTRALSIKKALGEAKARKDAKKVSSLKEEYKTAAKRFNESVARSQKFTKLLAESANASKSNVMNNAARQPAESLAEKNLRTKLAATNLFNAKLMYTNKLLQTESLSKKQKASVIERIDEAKSVREVKVIYESLSKALSSSSRTVNENATRKVIGSSSSTSRPGSTSLNEGFETDRWARLAGLNNR